jgi:hypothetical protein
MRHWNERWRQNDALDERQAAVPFSGAKTFSKKKFTSGLARLLAMR